MNKPISAGLIGLGAMGAAWRSRCAARGMRRMCSTSAADVAQAFAAQGGTACASPGALGAACDVVVSVVVNAAQTESVLFRRRQAAAPPA
jgi:putative dehydrogenase